MTELAAAVKAFLTQTQPAPLAGACGTIFASEGARGQGPAAGDARNLPRRETDPQRPPD
jgi:hypothetical protein